MTQFAVTLSRTIPAPRSQVYRAFLEPELLQQWMCPDEFVVSTAWVDEHVGGRHVIEMLAPDGERLAFESVIRDLVPDERIVLDFKFVGDGAHADEVSSFTATFRDAGEDATEVTVQHERLTLMPPDFDPPSVNAGWGSVLDKLESLYRERS